MTSRPSRREVHPIDFREMQKVFDMAKFCVELANNERAIRSPIDLNVAKKFSYNIRNRSEGGLVYGVLSGTGVLRLRHEELEGLNSRSFQFGQSLGEAVASRQVRNVYDALETFDMP